MSQTETRRQIDLTARPLAESFPLHLSLIHLGDGEQHWRSCDTSGLVNREGTTKQALIWTTIDPRRRTIISNEITIGRTGRVRVEETDNQKVDAAKLNGDEH